ncbi:MAG: M48 family metallopeptidase [Clostridiales bacterium]|nr:M48 family metallopeptidase [Clostridiales bacterium]
MKIPYQLIRSDRRTLSLTINEQGALIARSPQRMSIRDIERFIHQKENWIAQKQALVRTRRQAHTSFDPITSGFFPYLGKPLPIRYAAIPFVIQYQGTLLVPNTGDPKSHLLAWLKAQSPILLAPIIHTWSEQMQLAPSSVAYTTAKKRWGSMSSKHALRLNTALLCCDPSLIDYVVVHELAHIRHPNHSPAFHAHVQRYLPDHHSRRQRLKSLGYLTTLLQPTPQSPAESP